MGVKLHRGFESRPLRYGERPGARLFAFRYCRSLNCPDAACCGLLGSHFASAGPRRPTASRRTASRGRGSRDRGRQAKTKTGTGASPSPLERGGHAVARVAAAVVGRGGHRPLPVRAAIFGLVGVISGGVLSAWRGRHCCFSGQLQGRQSSRAITLPSPRRTLGRQLPTWMRVIASSPIWREWLSRG
jgi:hypothetical protein